MTKPQWSADIHVDAALAARLVAAQFPELDTSGTEPFGMAGTTRRAFLIEDIVFPSRDVAFVRRSSNAKSRSSPKSPVITQSDDYVAWLEAHPPVALAAGARRVVHGEVYARHLLLDTNARITGVIDWGDVHLGDPAIDIAIAQLVLPSPAHATAAPFPALKSSPLALFPTETDDIGEHHSLLGATCYRLDCLATLPNRR